jgi:hypothetical protein
MNICNNLPLPHNLPPNKYNFPKAAVNPCE